MIIFLYSTLLILITASALQEVSVSSTCEDYSKDKSKCLLTTENNVNCAYCKSATGDLCIPETKMDTKGFLCELQQSVSVFPKQVYFNESNSLGLATSYSSSAAVNYANSYCASHSEWLCAEFVARALNAGGLFSGVTDYGNYKGYNLRYVPDLHQALKSLYGWYQSSSGTWCGSSGQVLIYNGDEHAALAIGNCLLDQHNPSRCGTNSAWDTNIVLKPV